MGKLKIFLSVACLFVTCVPMTRTEANDRGWIYIGTVPTGNGFVVRVEFPDDE